MSVIVGLGSPHGDDQLGWLVIDRLGPRLPAGITAEKVHGGVGLLECLRGHDVAVVIDAAAPAGRPGTIRSLSWPCPELAGCVPWSTHGLGLVEAFQLAEVLGWLPRRVSIHTIEALDISRGVDVSAEITRGIDSVVDAALRSAMSQTLSVERLETSDTGGFADGQSQ